MAKRTVTQHTCDRCNRTYDETDPAKENAPNPPPAIIIEYDAVATETTGRFRQTVKFDDLCPKCTTRVNDLVKAIRLDDDKKTDGEKTTPETQEKPKALDPGDKKTENKNSPQTKASDAKVTP